MVCVIKIFFLVMFMQCITSTSSVLAQSPISSTVITMPGKTIPLEESVIKTICDIVSFLSNILTIITSSIAIYIFFIKRKTIAAAVKVILNYSYQSTLYELKEKVERLNEYNADNETDLKEIINIFNEILGQINGNPVLKDRLKTIAEKLDVILSSKCKLKEPKKRSLVSEIREQIKHLNLGSIESYLGE